VRQAEQRLFRAMRDNDLVEIDLLLHDDLRFVTPGGDVVGKADDLALRRSGAQQFSRFELLRLDIATHGDAAVTTAHVRIGGVFKEEAFEGYFRYLRCWLRSGRGWQVIGGSVQAAPDPGP
jgi:ketosteroid isomerase-like protein